MAFPLDADAEPFDLDAAYDSLQPPPEPTDEEMDRLCDLEMERGRLRSAGRWAGEEG